MPSSHVIPLLAAMLIACGLGCSSKPSASRTVDLLVVAPHSDDEAIGCTATIRRALAANKRVGIVVVTTGDGHVKAAAALAKKPVDQIAPADMIRLAWRRQKHTLSAMEYLGVDARDIHFLGYPDGGLAAMYRGDGVTPYDSPHSGASATYGSPEVDYHTRRHGQPASYTRHNLDADLVDIIRTLRPAEIYTTNHVDTHADHAATFWFVRDAARRAAFAGSLRTFVVHGEPPSQPPTLRLELSPQELTLKRDTLKIYHQGVSPVHDYLADKYTRPQEEFWEQ